jgi:hypothetical protein
MSRHRMADTLHNLSDDRTTHTALYGAVNVLNAQRRRARQGFHSGHEMGRRRRTPTRFPPRLRRRHPRFDSFGNQGRF